MDAASHGTEDNPIPSPLEETLGLKAHHTVTEHVKGRQLVQELSAGAVRLAQFLVLLRPWWTGLMWRRPSENSDLIVQLWGRVTDSYL